MILVTVSITSAFPVLFLYLGIMSREFLMCQFPFIILLAFTLFQSQPRDSLPVFNYIQNGDVSSLSAFLNTNEVNGRYGLDSITLLSYAILTNQHTVIKYLIEAGADVNLNYLGTPPLSLAVLNNQQHVVRLLLKHGAYLNALDLKGNSALILAASKGDLEITKILVRRGANLNYKNPSTDRAYDIAVKSNYQEVSEYLRDQYEKKLPDMSDGPFVKWNNERIRIYYLVHDSARNITKKIDRDFKTDSDTFIFKGFADDRVIYRIRREEQIPGDDFNNVHSIMVLGDLHGCYDSLIIFLRNNRVIDQENNWIWGNGHLVFIGDVFDRGEKVTETFWLIYQLEEQAKKQGGALHFILGNHEMMIMRNENNYINDKYYYLTKKAKVSYSSLFNKKTILGKWLRSRNTIIKINDHIFVHAGISPDLAFTGLSINEINNMVRSYINHPERHPYNRETEALLLGYSGPFWYRGYFEASKYYNKLSDIELDKILSVYNASTIFIGHTNVSEVSPIYHDRIYPIDVPFYSYGYPMHGLLIQDNIIYLLNSSGDKQKL